MIDMNMEGWIRGHVGFDICLYFLFFLGRMEETHEHSHIHHYKNIIICYFEPCWNQMCQFRHIVETIRYEIEEDIVISFYSDKIVFIQFYQARKLPFRKFK